MWSRIPPTEWDLSALHSSRRTALEQAAEAETIFVDVLNSARLVSSPAWQKSCERSGFFRVEALFAVDTRLFDLLFNGPTGYRAQFYAGVREGEAANRYLTEGLTPIVEGKWVGDPASVDWRVAEASLRGVWTKVWPRNDLFKCAPCNELRARQWVVNCGHSIAQGLKAPLDADGIFELKGTFIDPYSLEE